MLVTGVLAVAAAMTWWDVESDRQVTLQESARLTDALAGSVEDHLEATLRDAANAAISAAMLVEERGGAAAMGGERLLHQQLKRELWDERSTARLVVADAQGLVLASSAEFPVKPGTRIAPGKSWPVPQARGRTFHLGAPVRSALDGQWIIPYVCDLLGPRGEPAGTVRAEVRVQHFVETLAPITALHQGVVNVATSDGVTMLRLPLQEQLLGQTQPSVRDIVAGLKGRAGSFTIRSPLDGLVRTYSWQRMDRLPLLLAIGMDRDAVLAGWEQRAWRRVGVVGGAGIVLVALAAALVLHLRRLARSQEQLYETQARYWRAVENSAVGVIVVSLDGHVELINPAFCHMTGYDRDELVWLGLNEITAPEFREERRTTLEALRSGELRSWSGERRIIAKGGREVWAHVHTEVLLDAQQRPTGLITHFEDTTERRRAEQALRALNQELEQRVAERTAELSRANQDLEAFSYSAAHDLRGPLGRLSMYVDVLARDLGGPQGEPGRRIASIRRQVHEMMALIDRLLALARTSRASLHEDKVRVGDLVQEVALDLAPELAGRRVEWRIGELPTVRADRGLLREVLGNLLGNAVKYTRNREVAVIEVGTEPGRGTDEAVVYIRDNGAGFDMAHAGELFAPFKRLHTAGEFEGTGIGLAIVQRILERHGGRVWAEAEPGRGATFRFALRAHHEAAEAQPA